MDSETLIQTQKNLQVMGIPPTEIIRVLLSMMEEPNPIATDGFPVTGIDLAGNVNPVIVPDTGSPPYFAPNALDLGWIPSVGFQGFMTQPTPDPLGSVKTNEPDYSLNGSNIGHTFNITYLPAEPSLNWSATASKLDSQPSMQGEQGFVSDKSIPEWRYPVEDSQITIPPFSIAIPPSDGFPLHEAEVKKEKSFLEKIFPWLALFAGIGALTTYAADKENQKDPELIGKFKYNNQENCPICKKFSGRVFNLIDRHNRPIVPAEGLGYTTTHPNCECTWTIQKTAKKQSSLTRSEQSIQSDIESDVNRKAKKHELHIVAKDGHMSKKTTGKNPIKEAIGMVNASWLDEEYITNAKNAAEELGGRLYLIKAAEESITDHRSEGELYRRKLAATELQKMVRTAISKGTDINHLGKEFRTGGIIVDGEWDPNVNEMQYLVIETDPEIIAAIDRGDIADVSINGGAPRKEVIEPCEHDCIGDFCELCNVPVGVVLAELDGIGFTWVVNRPIMWKGQLIQPAKPGIGTTLIQPI